MSVKKGHCLCGAVSFEYEGPENWRAHCHCESCRRATSSAFTTYMGVPNGKWRFTGAEPAVYESSPGVRRMFCGRCGSPVAYQAERFPNEIHFFAASLEDSSDFKPQAHVYYSEHVPWVVVGDDLPKLAKTSSG